MISFQPIEKGEAVDPNDPDNPIDAAIGPDLIEFGAWQSRLILFQRIVGSFMLAKGLIHWSLLLAGGSFLALPIEAKVAAVFFAVIDLIAGVALWLGSGWGAALWLFAVISQVVAGLIFLQLSVLMLTLTSTELALVGIYAFLRYKAYREEQR
jgi:hypothetical protein